MKCTQTEGARFETGHISEDPYGLHCNPKASSGPIECVRLWKHMQRLYMLRAYASMMTTQWGGSDRWSDGINRMPVLYSLIGTRLPYYCNWLINPPALSLFSITYHPHQINLFWMMRKDRISLEILSLLMSPQRVYWIGCQTREKIEYINPRSTDSSSFSW